MAHPSRIFQNPDELEEAWNNYKESRVKEAKEWAKIQYVGKDGDKKTDYPKLPLTMAGFEVYCYKNHGTVHHYFDNKEGYFKDFGVICRMIKLEIRENQITGGLLNLFNSSITQRLQGLTDKSEVSQSEPRVFKMGD